LGGILTNTLGMGSKDVLEVCKAVELSCAELYYYFADLSKDDRESYLLWLKTAMEEENHARLFELVAKLRQNNIVGSIRTEQVDAEDTLLYVRSLIEKVRNRPPSQEEALRIAIDLEKMLDSFMLEKVIRFADQSYEKSFLAIANTDSRHLESLKEVYGRLPESGRSHYHDTTSSES